MSEGSSKDGEFDGKRTQWHENGQKHVEGTRKDGKLNGKSTAWYENGQKQCEGTYKDGELIEKIEWDEDGTKR